MGLFSRWIRRRIQGQRQQTIRTRQVRPTLAELEARVVPAVTASHFINHGGPVLGNVQVELVYEGAQWNSASLQPAMSQVNSFAQYIVGTPFLGTLAQYGVNPGQVTGSVVLPDSLGSNVSPQQLEDLLAQHVADGTLPAPDSNTLYVVLTPPGVAVNDHPGYQANYLGYHSSFIDGQGNQDAYAVLPYPGGGNPQQPGLDQFQSLTDTFSHELAEAVTDPYVNNHGLPSGWDDYTFTPGDPYEGEVADIAENAPPVFLNGYAVTQLWSNQADSIVAPNGSATTSGTGSLGVTAEPVTKVVAGQSFTATVATVTDTLTNAPASSLTATINWGDGSSADTVSVTTDPNSGDLLVEGTHTYANPGRDRITVTVTDPNSGDTAVDRSTVTVGSSGTTGGTGNLNVTGQNVTAVAGKPFLATVGTVSDPGAHRGSLVAKVDWGDGSQPSLVPLQGPDSQGNFNILGWHDYETSGNYNIALTVYDRAGDTLGTGSATATVNAPSGLHVTGQPIEATAGTSFSGTVATITDPGVNASNLTATINWGDGSAPDTTATVTTDSNGNLIVQGTHTYTNSGHDRVTVTVTDTTDNSEAHAVTFADVRPAPTAVNVHVVAVNAGATAGQSFTDAIAVVYAPGASASDLQVSVNWGDGTTDSNVQVVPLGTRGVFIITGTHTYANSGQDTINVTVTDSVSGKSGSDSSTAYVASAPSTPAPTTTTTPPTTVTDPTPDPTTPPDTTTTTTTVTPKHRHHTTHRHHFA